MKKRKLLSIVLTLCMILSMFTVLTLTATVPVSAATNGNYMAKLDYTGGGTSFLENEISLSVGTYQLDVDYYLGSSATKPYTKIEYGGSQLSRTVITEADGHYTARFTVATTGPHNVMLAEYYVTGIIYYANPVLKRVENDEVTGNNLLWDFSKQYTNAGATVTTTYAWGGQWYKSANAGTFTIEADKRGLFSTSANGESYMAKLNYTAGGSWTYLHSEMTLTAGTYQFDVDYIIDGSTTLYAGTAGTATKKSSVDKNGHLTMIFVATAGTARVRLSDANFSDANVIYLANPVLKKVEGGVPTGNNLVWDFSKQYSSSPTISSSYSSSGQWYKDNDNANATFTAEKDANGWFRERVYVGRLDYTSGGTYLQNEINLEVGTYQLDIDYRLQGSASRPYTKINASGNTQLPRNIITESDGHYTAQFTVATAGVHNVMLAEYSLSGIIYYANPVLKKVVNNELTGDNLLCDFYKQFTFSGGTITTTYAWGGIWYKSVSAGSMTAEVDTNGLFESLYSDSAAISDTSAAATKMVHVAATTSQVNYVWHPVEAANVVKPSTKYRLSFYWENVSNAPIDAQWLFQINYYTGSAWAQLVRADTLAGAATAKSITKTDLAHGQRINIDFTTPADCQSGGSLCFVFGDINAAISNMTFNLADLKLYTRDGSDNLTEVPTTDIGINEDLGIYYESTTLNPGVPGFICERYVGTKYGYLSFRDIPANYFAEPTGPKMLSLKGATGSTGMNALAIEKHLTAGATYQFDIDYRVFGGFTSPRISLQAKTTGSYDGSNISPSATAANVDGAHKSVQFTMPSNANASNNFKTYIGQGYPVKRTGSVYFANAKLRQVSGGVLGDNLLKNGDFRFCDMGAVTGDYELSFLDWTVENISTYPSVELQDIPDGFFEGTEISGRSDIAVKVESRDYTHLQFKATLEPGTYYKLSYDYRNLEDTPNLEVNLDAGTPTVTKLSSSSGGYYRNTYEIYNAAENVTGDTKAPNTRFRIAKFGADGGNSGGAYIGNVKLYKLTGSGGSTVGANLVGNLNAIYGDSNYSSLTNVGDTISINANEDDSSATLREQANGWLVYELNGEYTSGNLKLVKVPENFFCYKSAGQRLEIIRKVILGYEAADGFDPHYDPNNDGIRSNVKDLVHSKVNSVYGANNTTTTNTTDSIVTARFASIMDNTKTTATKGTVYYVSNAGNDSKNGKTEANAFATVAKATNTASAGDTILLHRGDVFYNATGSDTQAFSLKSGVKYGAYGTGAKPILSGSTKNWSGSSNWTETSSGSHVWYCQYQSSSDVHTETNAGMIYFINGSGKVTTGKNIAKRYDYQNYQYLAEDLDSDLEFFAPYKSGSNTITAGSYSTQGRIYVYSNTNPGSRFANIQIGISRQIAVPASGSSTNHTILDNIAVMYGGGHGISGAGISYVDINECEIAYIGGVTQVSSGNKLRFGNGVQIGQSGSNDTVTNCYVHDCFDAGITFQAWSGTGTFNNIQFTGNVIENCHYNIEWFTEGSNAVTNITINNNILRNAGYGWGSVDRCDTYDRCANLCVSKNNYYSGVSNMKIQNNIFDCTKSAHVMWTWADSPARHAGVTATGNTFIQKKGAIDWRVMAYGPIGGSYTYASDRASLATAVATFDTNPNAIVWLGSIE